METKRERVRASAAKAVRKRTRKEKVCASAAEAMRGCEGTMGTRGPRLFVGGDSVGERPSIGNAEGRSANKSVHKDK